MVFDHSLRANGLHVHLEKVQDRESSRFEETRVYKFSQVKAHSESSVQRMSLSHLDMEVKILW